MTPDDTETRLRQSATGSRARTPDCPDEHLVAGFVEGRLGDEDQARIEGHVADCAACASLIGELSRLGRDTATEAASELALARARRLGAGRRSGWMSFMPNLAAAAVAVVCVSALIHFTRVDSPTRTTRSSEVHGASLQVLSPAAGATLAPDALNVRWTGVPAARYYEVRIVTDAGEIVSEERVESNDWHPGQGVVLEPGADYFVRVEAHVAGARAIRSEHVPFRIVKRE
jgi:hypothetical protein